MSMAKLQTHLPILIGRTIKHIVVREYGNTRSQLFFYFTDGTYYEFYGGWIDGTGGVSAGGIECKNGDGYHTDFAMLEVLDANTTIYTGRPPRAAVDPNGPSKLARWLRKTRDIPPPPSSHWMV